MNEYPNDIIAEARQASQGVAGNGNAKQQLMKASQNKPDSFRPGTCYRGNQAQSTKSAVRWETPEQCDAHGSSGWKQVLTAGGFLGEFP